MKKKILVISGGFSKEREISIQTGIQVARELKKNGYIVKVCEPDNEIYKIVEKFKPKLMQSYEFELHRSNKHLVWRHRTGVKIHTASTPSCRHALNQVERDIRRKLSL